MASRLKRKISLFLIWVPLSNSSWLQATQG
jgi:hypothetical protein